MGVGPVGSSVGTSPLSLYSVADFSADVDAIGMGSISDDPPAPRGSTASTDPWHPAFASNVEGSESFAWSSRRASHRRNVRR